MPLVIPDLNEASAQGLHNEAAWQSKLLGKTISTEGISNETTFASKDLPEKHRIVKPGQKLTRDFHEDRLNVHVDLDGTVRNITFG